jgi:hypothetical protein
MGRAGSLSSTPDTLYASACFSASASSSYRFPIRHRSRLEIALTNFQAGHWPCPWIWQGVMGMRVPQAPISSTLRRTRILPRLLLRECTFDQVSSTIFERRCRTVMVREGSQVGQLHLVENAKNPPCSIAVTAVKSDVWPFQLIK